MSKPRLFLALIVAAAFSFWTPKGWRRIWHALTLWFDWRKYALADETTISRRLECCRACPLYAPKMQTCGTPLRPRGERGGCHCYIPALSRLQDAECWLDSVGLTSDGTWNGKIPVDRQPE